MTLMAAKEQKALPMVQALLLSRDSNTHLSPKGPLNVQDVGEGLRCNIPNDPWE